MNFSNSTPTSDTITPQPLGLVVLISGSGTNLQAIIDAIAEGHLSARLLAVISNRPLAGGLQRAALAGIPHLTLDHTLYPSREAFDTDLQQHIDQFNPDWVVLAGYMRLLSTAFVEHYRARMVNIHPSLLPAYKGLDTHARVLAAGDAQHGCSVHLVTPELDAGAILGQRRVNVLANDTVESLSARVQREEHVLYPQCLQLLASGRLTINTHGVPHYLGNPLATTGLDLTGTSLA